MIIPKFILSQYSTLIKHFHSINLIKLTPEERVKTLIKMALPNTRENPIIMNLSSPEFRSIFTEELNSLVNLFKKYGYEIRIAGGAVRDLLMEIPPKDLDFATTATPTEMKEMFTKENIRMINMNGEKHGTITPRINDNANFEVTTLRIDVVTDGRRAEVQFTTNWLLDAFRRDLTINSMYLDLDGSVYDYFYGYDDLKNRRVAFVGDAATRIQEDYLRILRYFRFYGRIAAEPNNHEEQTLRAIRENAEGLGNISGERIWTELKRVLENNFAGNLMLTLIECGLAPYIGLPNNPNVDELEKVWKHIQYSQVNAITLLSSLLKTQDDAVALNARLKLSAFERDLALFIVEHRGPKLHSNPLLAFKQLIVKSKSKPTDTRKMVIEVLKYNNSPHIKDIVNWDIPKFPISGSMLKEKGVESGRFMGAVMAELKNNWADSNFSLSVEEILKQVPDVVNTLLERKKKK